MCGTSAALAKLCQKYGEIVARTQRATQLPGLVVQISVVTSTSTQPDALIMKQALISSVGEAAPTTVLPSLAVLRWPDRR